MPLELHGIQSATLHKTIRLLVDNLINIRDTTGEFLLHLPDGRVIDTKGWSGWEWTHGIGLYGIWQYYTLTGDASLLRIITDWFRDRFAAGGTTKNINTMSVLLTLAYVYEETGDRTYLPWLDSWAEWAMYGLPRTKHGGMQHITYSHENKGQLWDDTLVMTVLPLAKIGKLLGREEYVDEARRQFLLHCQYLFDAPTGLFFHGWQFDEEGPGGHHFARARWARGNSWLTIVVPELVELLELKPGDPLRTHLLAVFGSQCEALSRCQGESGLWRTLLDVSEAEGSYEESSATAGFAYGMLKGVRKRYVGKDVGESALNAVKAVIANIDESGELQNTSFGTPVFDTLQGYMDVKRTSMPYGQAMAMMALVEGLRMFL
ncbi:MAG: hypothetical protein MMC23_008555 [Stictis urceolatum]|nr:hypothetical protein [Stictis urceolata]